MLHVAAVLDRLSERGDGRASHEEGKARVPRGGDGRDGEVAKGAGEDGEGGFAREAQAGVSGFVEGDGRASEGEG